MAELKTQRNDQSPDAFIASVAHPQRKADCLEVMQMMKEIVAEPAAMWGGSIVGFGSYHYRSVSGREGDWFLTGFSPRKQSLTLYIMSGFDRYDQLMSNLGKFKTGRSCLYVNKLDDIDRNVLRALITESVAFMRSYDHIK